MRALGLAAGAQSRRLSPRTTTKQTLIFSFSPLLSLLSFSNLKKKSKKKNQQDKFWTDGRIKGMVKNHFQTLLNRRNVFSGLQWKEDPAIFGMDLFNEPR